MILGVLALLTVSCSSDDSSSSEDKSILPKTISYTYPDFPQDNVQVSLQYSGNKIVSSTNGDSKTVFTYDGDKIIKQEQFLADSNGKVTKNSEALYSYENGKLQTRILKEDFNSVYPDGQYIDKTIYKHISSTVIEYAMYDVNPDTKAETKRFSGILTYKDGNIAKEDQTSGLVTSTRTYDYDKKNNPFKNVLGFDLLLNEISLYSKNNVVKTSVSRQETTVPSNYLTEIIYNENQYPLKYTSFTGDGKSIEYQIEFTY